MRLIAENIYYAFGFAVIAGICDQLINAHPPSRRFEDIAELVDISTMP